jgi:hypothetical protein
MSGSSSDESMRLRRKSAFKEVGLNPGHEISGRRRSPRRPALKVRFRSKNDIFEPPIASSEQEEWEDTSASSSDDETTVRLRLPRARARPTSDKFALIAFVIIISTMIAQIVPSGKSRMLSVGAAPPMPANEASAKALSKRQNSDDPTDYCKKWGHQSALVNGTLYLYGGRKAMTASQTSDTWSMEQKSTRDYNLC